MTTTMTVPAALDGERVDRAVALVTGWSRRVVAELIAAGGVRLGGAPVTSRHVRVASGATLELVTTSAGGDTALAPVAPGSVPFTVVYEDADIIVVAKPSGVVVHPGAGHHTGTLAAGLVARYPDLVEAARDGAGDPSRPGIVHRLDKDTSGLLVVARNPAAWRALAAQLSARSMGRRYTALLLGRLVADEGTVDAPIGRSVRDRTRMAVTVGGRAARTRYRVLSRYSVPVAATLAEVALESGRTHQIRVHLAAIGHPVAGDGRYGGGLAPAVRAALGISRPFLHAGRLQLVHPATGETLEWEVPLPEDLVAVLGRLS
ncbi:MAG: RluA family pseudouridine synthase [Acidimicrobiales bacterium]